jgi:hypothetical protein
MISIERHRNLAVDQDADAVQALEGDVGRLAGDGLAQHLLRALLVALVGRAKAHLDIRVAASTNSAAICLLVSSNSSPYGY